jgi:hypothetical protein
MPPRKVRDPCTPVRRSERIENYNNQESSSKRRLSAEPNAPKCREKPAAEEPNTSRLIVDETRSKEHEDEENSNYRRQVDLQPDAPCGGPYRHLLFLVAIIAIGMICWLVLFLVGCHHRWLDLLASENEAAAAWFALGDDI